MALRPPCSARVEVGEGEGGHLCCTGWRYHRQTRVADITMADESGKDGVNAATLQIMAQEAASRAEASGILMRRKEADTGLSLLGHAPFALLPFKVGEPITMCKGISLTLPE